MQGASAPTFGIAMSRRASHTGFDEPGFETGRGDARSGIKYRLLLLTKLPMGLLAGLRVRELTDSRCAVSVPFKWLNRNPFRSTFWAVLGIAAEMSTGALVLMYTHRQSPSLATIITGTTGQFMKKAIGRTTFVCENGDEIGAAIREAMATPDPVEVICSTRGIDEAGEVVAEFTFTWSMKKREE